MSGLVSWEAGELQGQQGKEWYCHWANRTRFLRQMVFPEGYHAYDVVDAETGKRVEDAHPDIVWTQPGAFMPVSALVNPLRVGEGRFLYEVKGDYGTDNRGHKSLIQPFRVRPGQPEYSERYVTGLLISPEAQSIDLSVTGPLSSAAVEGLCFSVRIRENFGYCQASMVWTSDSDRHWDRLSLDFNGQGNPVSMERQIGEVSVFKYLGVTGVDNLPHDDKVRRSRFVFDAFLERIDHPMGSRLDLAKTAIGLYKDLAHCFYAPEAWLEIAEDD